MSDPRVVAARNIRVRDERKVTAELLHIIAFSMENMARAMDEEDEILGSLAGRGIADNLPLLPRHVREVFAENLTDEAAAGARAERLYWQAIADLDVVESASEGVSRG